MVTEEGTSDEYLEVAGPMVTEEGTSDEYLEVAGPMVTEAVSYTHLTLPTRRTV